jgi:gliding motility-associated-like protein
VDSISASFKTSSNIICDVSNIPFENKSRYALSPEFLWNFGDTIISSEISPIHSYEKDSVYNVILTLNSPIGCKDTISKSLRVYNNPKPLLKLINTNFCAPAKTEFQLVYGNKRFTPDSTYFLINDFEKIMGDSAFYTFQDTGLQSTKFVIHFGEGNCLIDSVLDLKFYEWPKAKFTSSSSKISIEEPTVIFENNSINATSWKWDFNDLDTSEIKDPGHRYESAGLYDVRLIVSNDGGCFDTIIQQIGVAPENFIKLPSGFSPNGDGKNEAFKILSAGSFELISFKIFNRWGNIVFETNDVEEGWDGKRKGKNQNSGTYIYYIKGKDKDGDLIERHGNFTLLR